ADAAAAGGVRDRRRHPTAGTAGLSPGGAGKPLRGPGKLLRGVGKLLRGLRRSILLSMRTWMLAGFLLAAASPAAAAELQVCGSAALYEPCEISFEMDEAEAAKHPNPYVSVEIRAEFRSPAGGRTRVASGYWDRGRVFRFRFSPDADGRWDFRVLSNLESVNGKIASFQGSPARTPGFIEVFNTRYFRYPGPNEGHFWLGDTFYRFAEVPWETFTRYVDARSAQKFNHMRG